MAYVSGLSKMGLGSGVKEAARADGNRIGEIRVKHVSHLGLSSVSSALLKDPPLAGLETLGAVLSSGMELGPLTLSFPLGSFKIETASFIISNLKVESKI